MKNWSFGKLLAIQLLGMVAGVLFLFFLRLVGVDPLYYGWLCATKAFRPDSLLPALFLVVLFILFLSFFINVALECFDHYSRKSVEHNRKEFIDIKSKLPKEGELVIVKLKDGTERECFRCECKDELHNGWAEPITGMGIKIDVVSWKYADARNSSNFKRRILIHVLNFVGLMLLYSMSLLIFPVIEDGVVRWLGFGGYVLIIYTLIFKEKIIQKVFNWFFKPKV